MKLGQFIFTCLSLIAFLSPKRSEGQTISGVINSYHKATAIINNGTYNSYSYSGITLQSIAGLSTGDRVLIIQMKGATINETTNSSSFGNISQINNAGKYEFSSICGFLNNTIVLSNHLINNYDVSMVQVVRVPVYENVTVTGDLTATAWDSITGLGGVLALEVNGNMTLNANINANGLGFKGGLLIRFPSCSGFFTNSSLYGYSMTSTVISGNNNGAYKGEGINSTNASVLGGKGKEANGGGGGNNHNAGGGGGSNYGAGGVGDTQEGSSCDGDNFGIGGLSLNSYGYSSGTNKIFLGGGGGSGHSNGMSYSPTLDGTPGGNGGGIIYIRCNTLIGNAHSITANGEQGINPGLSPSNKSTGDGGGGGGAGGVVLLNVTSYSGSVSIEARGAQGNSVGFQDQCPGPGGGGGGGVIWYAGATPGTTNVSGGSAGTITSTSTCTNGANVGSPGNVQSGFVAPQGTNTIDCSILPLDLLKQFSGKRNSRSIQLNWTLTNIDNVQKVALERKTGNEQFKKITEQFNPSTANGFYADDETNSNVTYRLVVYALNGERQYSNHVFFEAAAVKTFNLYPNPATNEVTIQLPGNINGRAGIVVTDVNGRQVLLQQMIIPTSQSNTTLALKNLPAGIYQLRLEINGEIYSAKLVKQ
jgi:hypothetical protein